MNDRRLPLRLLFVCTHNRCRSILAEAIANHFGEGRIEAASAGSEPAGAIDPDTLQFLKLHHIPLTGLESKSLTAVKDFNPDFVITLCDQAAAEPCPVSTGACQRIHWGLTDPSRIGQDLGTVRNEVYSHLIGVLKIRAIKLRNWVDEGMSREDIHRHLQSIADRYREQS